MGTCRVPEACTSECLLTGKPCTHYGEPFTFLLRLDLWFGDLKGVKSLWKLQGDAWVRVATSRSVNMLVDAFTSGAHVVIPAKLDPNGRIAAPLPPAPSGALF